MTKNIALFALLMTVGISAAAQSAENITLILEKEETTIMDFAYLVASEAGVVSSPFEAWSYCDFLGAFPEKSTAGDPVTPQIVSMFIMTAYGLDGGIMWSYTGKSRYAWKEMKSLGFWPAGTDPDSRISGRDLIRLMTSFYETWPEAQMYTPKIREADPVFRTYLLEGKGGIK